MATNNTLPSKVRTMESIGNTDVKLLNSIKSGKTTRVDPLWNYSFWTVKTDFDQEFNQVLLDELYSIAKEISTSPDPKNSLWDYPRPNLQILKSTFDQCVFSATQSIPELKDLKLKFFSDMAWPNVREPGQGIEAHAHPDTSYALTYYVKTQPNCGDLICYLEDGEIKRISPESGLLVILPFYMIHEIETNKSMDLRVSISADYYQVVDPTAENALVLKSWCSDMLKVKEWNSAS
jgi:hypothetical protein